MLLAALALLTGLALQPAVAGATTPGPQGPIFYALPGGQGIERVNPDGSGRTLVLHEQTTLPASAGGVGIWDPDRPAISPDGASMLFDAIVTSAQHPQLDEARRELFLYSIRDGSIQRLTPDHYAYGGRFRPGSTAASSTVAFAYGTGLQGIFLEPGAAVQFATLSGTPPTLSHLDRTWGFKGGWGRVVHLDWSPDGAKLAFDWVEIDNPAEIHNLYRSTLYVQAFPYADPHAVQTQSGDFGFQGIGVSWAPDGQRLLVKGWGSAFTVVTLGAGDAVTRRAVVFGSTPEDAAGAFAPSNDAGTAGDTIVTVRGNALYVLRSSETAGSIRGPLAPGVDAFWMTQPNVSTTLPGIIGVPQPPPLPVPTIPGITLPRPGDTGTIGLGVLCVQAPSLCGSPATGTSTATALPS